MIKIEKIDLSCCELWALEDPSTNEFYVEGHVNGEAGDDGSILSFAVARSVSAYIDNILW